MEFKQNVLLYFVVLYKLSWYYIVTNKQEKLTHLLIAFVKCTRHGMVSYSYTQYF